jgi:GxxExxY protein
LPKQIGCFEEGVAIFPTCSPAVDRKNRDLSSAVLEIRPHPGGISDASSVRMNHDHLVSDRIIGAAIAVHRQLGPGLLESPYKKALGIELVYQGLQVDLNRHIPLIYRGEQVGDYYADLIVENTVVVEIKSVSHLEPVFTAQVVTYLRLTNLHVGLILNFNTPKLIDGLKRVVL